MRTDKDLLLLSMLHVFQVLIPLVCSEVLFYKKQQNHSNIGSDLRIIWRNADFILANYINTICLLSQQQACENTQNIIIIGLCVSISIKV